MERWIVELEQNKMLYVCDLCGKVGEHWDKCIHCGVDDWKHLVSEKHAQAQLTKYEQNARDFREYKRFISYNQFKKSPPTIEVEERSPDTQKALFYREYRFYLSKTLS
jgi:hypothetical protein